MKRTGKISIRPIVVKNPLVKKGDEIMIQGKSIRALIDGDTTLYQTGLSEADVKHVNETLNYAADLSPKSKLGEPHPFWDSNLGKVKLQPTVMFLNIGSPLDFIRYHICLASRFVANSQEEYDAGDYPEATHIIFDEDKDADAKATKIVIRNKAIKAAEKLTRSKQEHILMVLEGVDYTNRTAEYLTIGIDNLVQTKPQELLDTIKEDADYLTIKATILKGLKQNVLKKKGLQIHYNGASLGTNVEEVVKHLLKPEYQDIFLNIQGSFK